MTRDKTVTPSITDIYIPKQLAIVPRSRVRDDDIATYAHVINDGVNREYELVIIAGRDVWALVYPFFAVMYQRQRRRARKARFFRIHSLAGPGVDAAAAAGVPMALDHVTDAVYALAYTRVASRQDHVNERRAAGDERYQ